MEARIMLAVFVPSRVLSAAMWSARRFVVTWAIVAEALPFFRSAQESENLPEDQLSERSGLRLAWEGEGTRLDEGSWMAWI
jgi:hypothetical protein